MGFVMLALPDVGSFQRQEGSDLAQQNRENSDAARGSGETDSDGLAQATPPPASCPTEANQSAPLHRPTTPITCSHAQPEAYTVGPRSLSRTFMVPLRSPVSHRTHGRLRLYGASVSRDMQRFHQ